MVKRRVGLPSRGEQRRADRAREESLVGAWRIAESYPHRAQLDAEAAREILSPYFSGSARLTAVVYALDTQGELPTESATDLRKVLQAEGDATVAWCIDQIEIAGLTVLATELRALLGVQGSPPMVRSRLDALWFRRKFVRSLASIARSARSAARLTLTRAEYLMRTLDSRLQQLTASATGPANEASRDERRVRPRGKALMSFPITSCAPPAWPSAFSSISGHAIPWVRLSGALPA